MSTASGAEDEGRTIGLFIFGIVCHLLGNTGTALGLCLQKRAHLDDDDGCGAPYYYSKRWMWGLFVYMSAQVLTALAFMFAAQSALAPLLPTTLVANSVFARTILKEQITKYDVHGMVFIAIGAGLVVSGAPVVDPPSGDHHDELDNLFFDYLFEGVFLYTACVIVLCIVGTVIVVGRKKQEVAKTLSEKENDAGKVLESVEGVVIGHTFLSGVFSGLTVTFCRCVSLVAIDIMSNGRTDHLADYPFYIFFILALGTGVWMVRELNMGLMYGDATTVVPVNIAFSLLFQVLLGQFYWQEWKKFEEAWWVVLFLLGIILSLASALYPTLMRQKKRRRRLSGNNFDATELEEATMSADQKKMQSLRKLTVDTTQVKGAIAEGGGDGAVGTLPGYCGMVERKKILGFELEAWPQFRIGGSLWPSGSLLAQWLRENSDLFPAQADYVELGAGVGLPSLVVTRYLQPRLVTLTDYADLVPLMQKQLELNFDPSEDKKGKDLGENKIAEEVKAEGQATAEVVQPDAAKQQEGGTASASCSTVVSTRREGAVVVGHLHGGDGRFNPPTKEAASSGSRANSKNRAAASSGSLNLQVGGSTASSSCSSIRDDASCSGEDFQTLVEARPLDWASCTEDCYPLPHNLRGYDFVLGADIVYVEEQDPLIQVLEAFFGGGTNKSPPAANNSIRAVDISSNYLTSTSCPTAGARQLQCTTSTSKVPTAAQHHSTTAFSMLPGGPQMNAGRRRPQALILAYRERSTADREYLEQKILPRFALRVGFRYDGEVSKCILDCDDEDDRNLAAMRQLVSALKERAGEGGTGTAVVSPEEIIVQEAAEDHDKQMGRTNVGTTEIYVLAGFS
ncbi:unnamed protein product [Amoebophrya sp. A25]|nr:unnamed protein product [Amoebophrya sp. A25]|eukprot:GSA25T00008500001.1